MGKTKGFIVVNRQLKDHWLSKDDTKLGRWLKILLHVNWEDKQFGLGNNLITVKRGQCAFSLRTWSGIFGCSYKTTRSFFDLLEKDGMIVRETIGGGNQRTTLLTVCKYRAFQDQEKNSSLANSLSNSLANSPQLNNRTNKQVYKGEINHDSFIKQLEGGEYKQRVEVAYMQFRIRPGSMGYLLKDFDSDLKLYGRQHKDLSEYVNHFINWLKLQEDKGKLNKYKL